MATVLNSGMGQTGVFQGFIPGGRLKQEQLKARDDTAPLSWGCLAFERGPGSALWFDMKLRREFEGLGFEGVPER